MNIEKYLKQYKAGKLSHAQLISFLKIFPFEDLGHTKIDHHRDLRTGFPEVIYGSGKSQEHLLPIIDKLILRGKPILITKIGKETAAVITAKYSIAEYNQLANMIVINKHLKKQLTRKQSSPRKEILIITAGTSDIAIAEEAAVVCEFMGKKVKKLYDVGVAGLHRLFAQKQKIFSAKIIIVIAGMEGALASVIAGLTDCPVIAVPTSVGYGANFKGLAALLSMLNCCAPGVTVVNIDNGFGAAVAALKILDVK